MAWACEGYQALRMEAGVVSELEGCRGPDIMLSLLYRESRIGSWPCFALHGRRSLREQLLKHIVSLRGKNRPIVGNCDLRPLPGRYKKRVREFCYFLGP